MRELTPEDIATYPLPGTAIPGDFAFSPDDGLITFLHSADGSLTRQLYALDPETGERRVLVTPPDGGLREENVSLEEALRRERQRQRGLGITQYAWARHANRVLVPLQGALYVQDGADAPLREILPRSAEHRAIDPQLSPDGAWIAYVQDAELHVVSTDGGAPRQLTAGARGTGKTHGLAEYVAQEEMGRAHGFWWSPDSRTLAFTEVDETHIPLYRIVHQGDRAVGVGTQEEHRYPFAGMPNAKVRLGVIAIDGGEPAWMDLGDAEYLARVNWLPDGTLTAQLENREQTILDLVRFATATGVPTTLLRETSDTCIHLHHMLRPLDDGGFLWASERTGFRHLYRYDKDGNLRNAVTHGDWLVDDIAAVNEERGEVSFTGTADSPLERNLYAVPLEGGEPRRILSARGWHTIVADHGAERFVDVYHSAATPPTVTLRSLVDGALIATIYDAPDPRIATLGLEPPEFVTLQDRTGETLYGAIYRPPARFGAGPFPTIVDVYGGPHGAAGAERLADDGGLRAQYLGTAGIPRLHARQSPAARGVASLSKARVWHTLGHAEVGGQVDGVRWLVSARADRSGARRRLRLELRRLYDAHVPRAARRRRSMSRVAGAPVTAWEGYDTHYTERYMGTPQSNPDGYATGSVLTHVEKITGKLLHHPRVDR